ncbi:NIPSNAP family protein [Gordonia sp. zg691]|uniref:NIPSNAP family protein n=1 Tax=Gordonia jinghuaiqii TaxID=2758710 RepID=UPI0016624560|nr:NIPSNAP family protein [Gordonia jinghuaiqii]MBD0863643.1 NIPSNAP family protein [Gordonia jinghuaiqii]
MIFEIRDYVAVPGKLPALIALFNEVSKPLMGKHELELVTAGMTYIGEDAFNGISYTVRFADLGDLDAKWSAFLSDPVWATELAARTADGPIVGKMTRRVFDETPFGTIA